MPNKDDSHGTILGMTALMGWLPALIMIAVLQFALENGARSWPDVVTFFVFGGMYLGLIALGAWVFSTWFGN